MWRQLPEQLSELEGSKQQETQSQLVPNIQEGMECRPKHQLKQRYQEDRRHMHRQRQVRIQHHSERQPHERKEPKDSRQQVTRSQSVPRIHLGSECMTEHQPKQKYQEGRKCMLRSEERNPHHSE